MWLRDRMATQMASVVKKCMIHTWMTGFLFQNQELATVTQECVLCMGNYTSLAALIHVVKKDRKIVIFLIL